jgi:hypothetical protein
MNVKNSLLYLSLLCSSSIATTALANQADPVEDLFTHIYKTKFWQLGDSVSGPGSELKVTQKMRYELTSLIKRFSISSIADAPCGDFNWMRHVDLGDCTYIGFDIVQELIDDNNRLFGCPTRSFKHANLIDNIIDKVDLIVCRDCLAHLTDEQIFKVLRNFKASGSKYLLVTTNYAVQSNTQIDRAGDWRKLNLEAAPFNFPRPLAIIQEDVPFTWEQGKHLALWFLDDIKV